MHYERLRVIGFALLGLVTAVGISLALRPVVATHLLQIHGRWLGVVPVRFDPMPSATPVSTARSRTGPARGPLRPDPKNGRYFTDGSGAAVYLSGSHTWANLQDAGDGDPPPVFDYTGFLDLLTAKHHNFFRLWRWEQSRWGSWTDIDGLRYEPQPYPRPGPGMALDGKPRFDVGRFDPGYFERLRQRVQQAGERGIYVAVMLFDGWSIEEKEHKGYNPWKAHPFNRANNVNGVDGDPNHDGKGLEIQSLGNAQALALSEAYVRKVVDTLDDLDNVLYEISNESAPEAVEWEYHMIRFIKGYEARLPKQHPVGMTAVFPLPQGGVARANAMLYASPADWISPVGDLHDRPAATGEKVVVADTDHLCGICGDRQWVWLSFTQGENTLFMDVWSCAPWWEPDECDGEHWPEVRDNLGYARDFADRFDLGLMTPQPKLFSSRHGLANASARNAEYLAYLPEGGKVRVDLSATPGELQVEWFDPGSGRTMPGAPVDGGGQRSLSAPFTGDAVLYLHQPRTSDMP